MAMPVQKPRARSDDLVIEEVDDELLVYDSTNKRGHCLGATAARVWRACDGYSDVSALSEALELDAEVVSQALDELDALELLDTQGVKVVQAGSGNGDGLTRRQLARRSARVGAGIAAAPLVYSINVSSAMALATPTPFQCALYTVQSCGTSSGLRNHRRLLLLLPGWRAHVRPAARPPSATHGDAAVQPVAGRRLRHPLLHHRARTAIDARGCCGVTGANAVRMRLRAGLRAAATRTPVLTARRARPMPTASRAATATLLTAGLAELGCCKSATVNCCDRLRSRRPRWHAATRRPRAIDCCGPEPHPACCTAHRRLRHLTGGVSGPGRRAWPRA